MSINRVDLAEIINLIESVDHDFSFKDRDLEDLFNDGFENCRQRILLKLSQKYLTSKTNKMKKVI